LYIVSFMKNPFIIFLSFLLLQNIALFGQIDTEFWFAVPEVTISHADRPIYLRISTFNKPGNITISLPANPSFIPLQKNIAANSSLTVDLTFAINNLENSVPNTVVNKGLYIKSSTEITAYYEVYGTTSTFGPANTDIFTLKGRNALGTEFYTPFQNFWSNHLGIGASSSFDIVATEDNTLVNITPSNDITGHAAGILFTVLLNKGQTYSARASSELATLHLGGSHVTSNKPVAITTKDDSVEEGSAYDLVGDQIVPLNIIGTEYIAIKSSSASINDDRIFICATQNNTDVFLNGNPTPATTLSAGQTFGTLIFDTSTYIQSSHPIYVFHISGMSGELGGALLPPLACTGSKRVAFTRNDVANNLKPQDIIKLNITIKNGYQNYFKLNGNSSAIPPSLFTSVPGTGGVWVAAQLVFSNSIIHFESVALIQNDSADFHLGVVHGINLRFFEYGFFSDYGHLDLGSDKYFCQNEVIELDGGFDKDSYEWHKTGNPNILATTQNIIVSDTGNYTIKVTKGACTFKDTISLFYNPPVLNKILGPDTAVCANSGIILTTDTVFQTYKWQNGNTSPSFKPGTSGIYYVDVTNIYSCSKRDSIYVTIHQLPTPHIILNKSLETFCADSSVTLDAGPGFARYLWQNGDTTQIFMRGHSNDDSYQVTVTDSNNCSNTDRLELDCSVFIEVPNLITPNNDSFNEVFFVKGLVPNKWGLEVFNRWGNRVYYNRNYDNFWDGKNESDGVYYYYLKHIKGEVTFKGWVQILR
jgi:gliding motility-associated-like protein